jgi:hypothetical protein
MKRTAFELYSEREQVQHYINKNYIEMREGLGNSDYWWLPLEKLWWVVQEQKLKSFVAATIFRNLQKSMEYSTMWNVINNDQIQNVKPTVIVLL